MDWEASLTEKNPETKPHLHKTRSRTKSADLSGMRKADSEITTAMSPALGGYNSDHQSEYSLVFNKEDGYRSDASDNGDEIESPKQKEKVDNQKPVAKLKRTLSEKLAFRRENRIAIPEAIPVDDSVHKILRQGANIKQVQKALKKMGHIDQTDSKGQSCLHVCASRGYTEIGKLFLRRGANVNLQDHGGFTPLHCAVVEKRLDSCLFLLNSKGIDVTITNNQNSNAVHYLVRMHVSEDTVVLYRQVLDILISKSVDINAQNTNGETPIHFCCMSNNIHTAAFLLERGADCNIQTELGETPLHYAVRTGCIKLVRILMENGADPTIKSAEGSTPVDVAEQYGSTDILDCLQSIIEEEIECQNTDHVSVISSLSKANENALTRAGWLEIYWKKNTWERCWTVINNQRIVCYPDDSKTGEILVEVNIGLTEIQSEDNPVVCSSGEKFYCFTVTEKGKEPISFATKTPEEREGWIEMLKETVQACVRLSKVYEKLKKLSKPRKRLRARERNLAYHNCQEGTRVLSAAAKSGSNNETLRLLLMTPDLSAACLGEIIDPDDEALIRCFVKFFLHHGVLLDFLKASITQDIRKTAVGETLFREMSLSTRMLSIYLELEDGKEYLRSVALELVSSIASIDHSLEVNPNNVGGTERINLKANLAQIIDISQRFLDRVLSSSSRCPLIFRELMLHTKQRVDRVFPNMTHAVVGGFVFLRFLCPAIVTPHKYGLLSKCPDTNSLRVFVLITKLLQSVSNGIEFDGTKEDYMLRLNPFIKKNRLCVNVFFDDLTDPLNIEQQKKAQEKTSKKPFHLSKDELQEVEMEIFKMICGSKEKMLALLTSQTTRVSYTDHDSDDENSAVEVDEI